MYAAGCDARKGDTRRIARSLHEVAYGGLVAVTTVRPATPDDVDRLVAWHADPEVSRYWDDETLTADQVRERLALSAVDSWIVEELGEPVGFLQSWWEPGPPRRGGLDGFLIPAARGRGVMPRAARELARALLAAGWAEVTVDPYAWNERAVRGWAKAGFVEVSRHSPDDEHTADWILMRFAP
jgi:RimJ/RimL family protein N-acetyltransferase